MEVDMGVFVLLVWMCSLWAAFATEAEVYIESSPYVRRSEASELRQALSVRGVDGRVVRIYVHELGWCYVYRSEPAAKSDMEAVLDRTTAPPQGELFIVDDGTGLVVGSTLEDSHKSPLGVPSADVGATAILTRMMRAHEAASRDAGVRADRDVVFRFRRVTEQRVVDHIFARRGGDLYVQIDVAEGMGLSSRFGIVAGRPWTDQHHEESLDTERVGAAAARFAPEHVLGVVATLTTGSLGALRPEQFFVAGEVTLGDELAIELRREETRGETLSVFVSKKSWRLIGMSTGADSDQVRWQYQQYQPLGDGSSFPALLQASGQDATLDHVVVKELDYDPSLPSEWFPVASP